RPERRLPQVESRTSVRWACHAPAGALDWNLPQPGCSGFPAAGPLRSVQSKMLPDVAPGAGAREDARRASRGAIMADVAAILERIRTEDIRTVDFRFTDLRGQWQHVAVAAGAVDAALLERGVMFDGSAVAGWR